VGRCGVDASGSGYGLVAGSCQHGNEPSGSIKSGSCFASSVTISFSRRTVLRGVSCLFISVDVTVFNHF
jgi:hypothetical protein